MTVVIACEEEMEVTLLDLVGRALTEPKKARERCELDVSGLAEGVYFVRMRMPSGVATGKLVIRR
jgi:hypothetical protein